MTVVALAVFCRSWSRRFDRHSDESAPNEVPRVAGVQSTQRNSGNSHLMPCQKTHQTVILGMPALDGTYRFAPPPCRARTAVWIDSQGIDYKSPDRAVVECRPNAPPCVRAIDNSYDCSHDAQRDSCSTGQHTHRSLRVGFCEIATVARSQADRRAAPWVLVPIGVCGSR